MTAPTARDGNTSTSGKADVARGRTVVRPSRLARPMCRKPSPAKPQIPRPRALRPSRAPTLAVRASSPLLPPLVFKSVDLLMVDGGKTRDRDATLRLADGAVQVLDGETRLRTAPYDSILAIYHSHSRDPRWVTPAGTAVPVVKVEGSKFRLFKGDRDWLTVRTKSEFIMLKSDSSSIGKIVAALESRTGMKVIRVGERN